MPTDVRLHQHGVKDHWQAQAHAAAPLGDRAVEDVVRETAGYYGLEVLRVKVAHPGYLAVSVTYRWPDDPADTPARHVVFGVPERPRPEPATWAEHYAVIKERQAAMPPHLRGPDCEDNQDTYLLGLVAVRLATRYDGLTYGDLTVAKKDGRLLVAPISRAGEIAFKKFVKARGLNTEDVSYAKPATDQRP